MTFLDPILLDATLQATERLTEVADGADALAIASAVMGGFGFSAFVLSRLPSPRMVREPLILLNGWPAGWSERYADAGHYAHDPIAAFCMASSAPFRWDEIPDPYWAKPQARQIAREAAAFDLNEGLCVPLHTGLGMGGLSLAGPRIETVPGLKHMASLLGHAICEAAERIALSRTGGKRLTVRERDILTWVAYGRTAGAIAEALCISEHTVGEHLKNIRLKLGSANNAHSVVRALQLGQLRL